LIGLAALAAGCASVSAGGGGGASVAAGAEVTRFHLGQDIARGEIAVEPLEGQQAGGIEFGRHAAAVERQLTALGWTVVRGNRRSEQVALIRVQQGAREAMARRSGQSIGVGGGVGGGGGGVGGGITVPLGSGRSGSVVVTELAVRMQRRSDGTTIWEGRAQGEARAGTPAADRAYAVDRLAPALFQGFPGESGRTIRVR
jgi:hypothetical protein